MRLHQNPCIKTKKVFYRGKKSKALTEVKPVENISKNLRCFLHAKGIPLLPICKAMHMGNKGLMEDNPSQKNCHNQLSHPS